MSIISQKKKLVKNNITLQENENLIREIPQKDYNLVQSSNVQHNKTISLVNEQVVTYNDLLYDTYYIISIPILLPISSFFLNIDPVINCSDQHMAVKYNLNLDDNILQCIFTRPSYYSIFPGFSFIINISLNVSPKLRVFT